MNLSNKVQERCIFAYNRIPGIARIYTGADWRIGVSDYKSVSQTVQRISFNRDYVGVNGNRYLNPGARVRFITDAASVTWVYDHTDLNTRSDAFNGVISFMIDGVEQDTATVVFGSAGEGSKVVSAGSVGLRTWEMIMPYGASVDFLRILLPSGASLYRAADRPTKTLLVVGDSITAGFDATKTIDSWAYKTGQQFNCQVVNMGYGSSPVDVSLMSEAASVPHDACIYLIGYNNFVAQTALATFKSSYTSAIEAQRAASAAPIYAVSLLWTGNTNTLTPANYRTQQSDAVTELADSGVTFIDGLTLTDNDTGSIPDNVHPNDTGSDEIVAALVAAIVSI